MATALSRLEPLDCEIGISSFEHFDKSFPQKTPVWDTMTTEQCQCWNGRRITIFGQSTCGVTALSNMLSGKTSTMTAASTPAKQFGPLKLRLLFDYKEAEADLCLELEGVGHYRLETDKPSNELLQTFPTWTFLSARHDARPEDSATNLEITGVNSSDLQHLRNQMVKVYQDIEDGFAIRLGFLLSETVVSVYNGANIHQLQEQVKELHGHYDCIARLQHDLANEYPDAMRETVNIHIVVNCKDASFSASNEAFHQWMVRGGLVRHQKQPEGHCAIGVYSKEYREGDRRFVRISYVALFGDSAEGQAHNSSVVAHILRTRPPKQQDISFNKQSPFHPVQIASSFLLPYFVQGKQESKLPHVVTLIAKPERKHPTYKVFTGQLLKRNEDFMVTREPLPDPKEQGILETLEETDPGFHSYLDGQEIRFTAVISNASHVKAERVTKLSSGKRTYFVIQAIIHNEQEPGTRGLYSRLINLHGLCKFVDKEISTYKVEFVFHRSIDCMM